MRPTEHAQSGQPERPVVTPFQKHRKSIAIAIGGLLGKGLVTRFHAHHNEYDGGGASILGIILIFHLATY